MTFSKPYAIVVDLDGTLANLNGRLPYGDAQKDCENDLLRQEVLDQVKQFTLMKRLIVSGRFDTYKEQTERWLKKHNIHYDGLFMREANDTRGDQIIKREIYEQHIEPFYKVVRVFDDRPKVIRMWRELGLDVVDVGNGVEF